MDKTFIIDKASSDSEYLYVEVVGLGTVVIHKTDDGVSVDMYPMQVADEPIASCWAFNYEFTANDGQEE